MKILSQIGRFLASFARPYPSRDWFFGLVLIFLVFLMLTSYAVYVFFAVQSGTLFAGSEGTPPAIAVTRGEVTSVLDLYRARALNYSVHNLPVPRVVDPAK